MNMTKWATFVGGVLFGTAGIKILSSKDAKKVYTHTTAAVLRAKDSVMETVTTVRENAEDIYADAKAINQQRAQQEAAALLVQEGWTVARTERYVEEVLQTEAPKEKKNRRPLLIRDIRFFLNSLDHSLAVMRSAGVDAKCHRAEEGEDLLLTIRIPRARPPAG